MNEDGLLEACHAENEALRLRIVMMDAAVDEYRRQMNEVLTSVSWRATATLRATAGRVRLAKRKLKALTRRLASPSHRSSITPTAGLFAPVRLSQAGDHLSPLLSQPVLHGARSPRLFPQPWTSDAKLLVVAHVYYAEVWPDIEDRLARMPENYDLIVTLVRGRSEGLEQDITRRFPNARIHRVENRGRDSGPLVDLARMGMFEGYDAILKVHTKRSVHRLDGDSWRIELLDGVLPSPEGVGRIVDLIRRDKNVGLVVPTGHIRGPETWGADQVLVEALAARIPFAFDPDLLRYPAGSMYWARPWVLQRLADLELGSEHFEPEADHLDGSTAHAIERFVGVLASASGLDQVDTADVPSRLHRIRKAANTTPRTFAFYLPQYHRTAENDAWWGEGFTDWAKVDGARPLFDGHAQPVEPGELGRYDLSDVKVMQKQGELAAEYGINGFIMYRYWFDGQTLLDTPLQNLLADPKINFPFALCWANESWTRRWDGLDQEVLMEQRYSPGWVDSFYESLMPALSDDRYIHVDGKPLLVIYRVGQLPQGAAAIERWRNLAIADGHAGLHVLAATASRDFEGLPSDVAAALDGLVRFPPGSGIGLQSVKRLARSLDTGHKGDVYCFDAAVDGADMCTQGPYGLRVHPGVMPGWDNTPRRGDAAYVFHGSNPMSFRRWLSKAADAAVAAGDDPLVFVNAWNEWAEGAHLEPDARFGRANLEAVRDSVSPYPPAFDARLMTGTDS
jgi:lipopolysaccharide biosynthesis protein